MIPLLCAQYAVHACQPQCIWDLMLEDPQPQQSTCQILMMPHCCAILRLLVQKDACMKDLLLTLSWCQLGEPAIIPVYHVKR